jgi:hypothetical protein
VGEIGTQINDAPCPPFTSHGAPITDKTQGKTAAAQTSTMQAGQTAE